MDAFNLIQEFSPAQVLVAVVLLPWLVVALMQMVSSTQQTGLDDNFGAHAEAALRWADKTPDPVTPLASEVLPYRVRPAVRVREDRSYIEPEAA